MDAYTQQKKINNINNSVHNLDIMNTITVDSEVTRLNIFNSVSQLLAQLQLPIVSQDVSRPWGGFFVIDEVYSTQFIQHFFETLKPEDVLIGNKLSPKILVVAPNTRLSWQYHHRRAELWKLIAGNASIVTSQTNEEQEPAELILNQVVTLAQGERHRLIGSTNTYGIIAEIWQHTDAANPSNEDDIVRLQDDYGRAV